MYFVTALLLWSVHIVELSAPRGFLVVFKGHTECRTYI